MSTARVYELEAAVAELRDANLRSQATIERLERDRQHALEELETLHASHSRLEARFFETETGLATATAKLDRALRTNSTLESTIDQKSAALDREREAWSKKEVELNTELAAAKRKAMVQRRQTVSTPSSHSRSGSTAGNGLSHARKPSYAMPSGPLSPLTNARALQRSSPDYSGSDLASDDALDREYAERQMQTQIHQLTRKLREAEARAQQAADQAGRLHMDSEQTAADLDAYQRKAERLEHTVKQLGELNESLREDNESYQVLLQMSTMKGGFSFTNPRSSLESRASSGKWANGSSGLADDGTPDGAFSGLDDLANMPGSPGSGGGLDLASELGQVLDLSGGIKQPRMSELEEQVTQLKEELRKTKYERRHLGDENKALSLYVNKILGRILASSDGLEAVLSRDYESAGAKKRAPIPAPAPFAVPSRPSAARPVSPLPEPLPFAARGSGDGITSVFIPPTSPTMQRAAPPIIQPPQEPAPQSPPPYTRRARSATVAAGQALAESQANGDVSASAATVSGAWWKRMSVRLGSGWHAPEEPQPE
ncbi:hypothetical protein H4S04_008304 [Coemansia sp. S16]|nr:hypothetical protein H4S04_008304 [Coemansia sp. S16]KAJ2051824.1 hypothetical protein GGH13_008569 [Coemansia sp. S155-1]